MSLHALYLARAQRAARNETLARIGLLILACALPAAFFYVGSN